MQQIIGSQERKKHVLIYLPKNFSNLCIERLEKSGLSTLIRNESNEIIYFKSELGCFHQKKLIPPLKYGNDNI